MVIRYKNGDGKLITKICVLCNRKIVRVKNYADFPLDNAFGLKSPENVTWDDVYRFLISRTYPENRANINEILEDLGLKEYDPIKMCRITRGRMTNDQNWLTIRAL